MSKTDLAEVRSALAIDWSSSARDRTVDITTVGRRSGRPRRIEIWFYRFEEAIYLSGLPGRREWFLNLQADPRFVFHLKHGVHADLPARASVVTDPDRRRSVFTSFVGDMNQPHNPARIRRPTSVEAWVAGSPLVEVLFDDEELRPRPVSGRLAVLALTRVVAVVRSLDGDAADHTLRS